MHYGVVDVRADGGAASCVPAASVEELLNLRSHFCPNTHPLPPSETLVSCGSQIGCWLRQVKSISSFAILAKTSY